ncbi:hypothetical protein L6452_32654 [Arctium lappa]|uniref:Uncharacterized protein n=1 Tax=Arctium lappa TaxID=4217 RepID=A0ACB8Z9I8_ARCLA|nr:hypothetical protein L6452_32654 [Arctium lappa]
MCWDLMFLLVFSMIPAALLVLCVVDVARQMALYVANFSSGKGATLLALVCIIRLEHCFGLQFFSSNGLGGG